MAENDVLIQAEQLTKRFPSSERGTDGFFTAVDGVNLRVAAGEVLALLGPNGAGKTTTVRMLAAILMPTAGRAEIAGFDVARYPREVRRRVGLLTEMPGLYLRMRAADYLDFFGRLYGVPPAQRWERIETLMARFGMAEALHGRLGEFSKGMRQKLALIRAMLHDPPVLLLDEPTSAMDPYSAKLVRDSIASLRSQRRAIIVCTHNLTEAEMLADRIAIIRRGRIVALGTPSELKRQLLGPPLMEVRVAQPLDGLLPRASELVQVESWGSTWLRYRTEDPRQTNPRLVRWLTGQGVEVVTLSEVPRNLESVYLRVVEGMGGEEG